MAKKSWTAIPSLPGCYREADKIVIRVRCKDLEGKEKTKTERVAGTTPLDEVDLRRAEMLVELVGEVRGAAAPKKPQAPSFNGYVERWLEGKEAALRASSADVYVNVLASHILPKLGPVPVTEIRRETVQEWCVWAADRINKWGRFYAQATLDKAWAVLGVVLRDAAADYDIPDPTRRVRKPKSLAPRGRVRPGVFLPEDQLHKLLDTIREHYPEWEAEIIASLVWGLRPGELYALTWPKIDFGAGVVTVDEAVWRGEVDATKTDDPRTLPLLPELADLLQAHRQRMLRQQHPGLATGIVFPAAHGGYRGPSSTCKMLHSAARRAGLDKRAALYDFRRMCNNAMRQGGVDRVVLRALMGHTTEEMTGRYSRGTLEEKTAATSNVVSLAGLRPRAAEGQ